MNVTVVVVVFGGGGPFLHSGSSTGLDLVADFISVVTSKVKVGQAFL
jgi:hypothetical protein